MRETENNIQRQWYAVYTGSKKEKFVGRLLTKKRIENYIPLVKKTKQYASRIKTTELPLITCYVFVKVGEQEYRQVLETEYVMGFIKTNNKPARIKTEEIELLKFIVGNFNEVSLVQGQEIEIGDKVEILSAELTGIKGEIVEIDKQRRMRVQLKSIGIGLIIQVEASKLRRIS